MIDRSELKRNCFTSSSSECV